MKTNFMNKAFALLTSVLTASAMTASVSVFAVDSPTIDSLPAHKLETSQTVADIPIKKDILLFNSEKAVERSVSSLLRKFWDSIVDEHATIWRIVWRLFFRAANADGMKTLWNVFFKQHGSLYRNIKHRMAVRICNGIFAEPIRKIPEQHISRNQEGLLIQAAAKVLQAFYLSVVVFFGVGT